MYNRDKIIQTLRDITEESKKIEPYVVIAQPRRSRAETPAQTFKGHGNTHTDLMGFSTGFIDVEGEIVDVARNYLIEQVIESGAKYMFFIGDDTVVPWNAFSKLHETAEANPDSVVVGVYYMKAGHPMIMTYDKEHNYILPADVTPGQILDIWMCGMDCMLIPVKILKEMKKREPDLPFCVTANGIEGLPFIGEDNFFTYRIRNEGYRILCNTDVQCLHMDMATGKYTAHPSVNLDNYYSHVKPTTPLTLEDKKLMDRRWALRLPKQENPISPEEELKEIVESFQNPIGVLPDDHPLRSILDATYVTEISDNVNFVHINNDITMNELKSIYEKINDGTMIFGDRITENATRLAEEIEKPIAIIQNKYWYWIK